MAIVDFPELLIPMPPSGMNTAPTRNDFFMTAGANYVAAVFRAPKDGTLDKFEFLMGDIANMPDNPLTVGFEDIDLATGLPDGTQDQFRLWSPVTPYTWAVPDLITDDGTNGGVKRTVTQGQLFAVTIRFSAFVAGDFITIAGLNMTVGSNACPWGGFPYTVSNGSKTESVFGFALKYDDGSYLTASSMYYPISTFNTRTFNDSSTPDEIGYRFIPQVTCQIGGMWWRGTMTGNAEVNLLDSADTPLVTAVSLDADVEFNGNQLIRFDSNVTLTGGDLYRLTVKPTSGSDITMYDMGVNANALLACVEGGVEWYKTQRTNAGAWTNTDTLRPWMGLLLNGFDSGVVPAAPQISSSF